MESPDTSSAATFVDSHPAAADEMADPEANNRLAKPARGNHSTETFDLAGDLDLEARLGGPAGAGKEAGDLKEGVQVVASGPATLPHDDAENPRNWSTPKKVFVNAILCTWVLSLTYASTAYVSSLPALEHRYNSSQELTISGVTFTVLGFAAGPLLLGPSSELLGRRAVYCFTGLLYSAFSFGAAFAPNMQGLLVFRFLLGFFGAASINNVPASIGDFTVPANRGAYSILYALMAFGGPALGPLCSSFIETNVGYQWNFRVMAIFSAFMSLLVAFVPETHGPTLLKWRTAKEGRAPPPPSRAEIISIYKIALSRPIVYLFSEPTVTLVSIYLSTLYGILYGFFEAFSIVYEEIRGFKLTSYGLTYISLGLGFLIACGLLGTVGKWYYDHYAGIAAAKGLKTQPEARLGLAYFGAILSPISLFIFAWTAPFPHVHWIAPCIAEALFACSMLCIFTAFIPYLIDVYLTTAASALASGMASRALIGSIFPLFALQMFHKLSVQGATSLLGGLALCLAPIPFVFRKYGPWMRIHSKHAVVQ